MSAITAPVSELECAGVDLAPSAVDRRMRLNGKLCLPDRICTRIIGTDTREALEVGRHRTDDASGLLRVLIDHEKAAQQDGHARILAVVAAHHCIYSDQYPRKCGREQIDGAPLPFVHENALAHGLEDIREPSVQQCPRC